jgi:hypothetical protein
MIRNGLRSQIHRKKPKGKPMPEAIARANGKKSKVRAFVEHVFARQKGPMEMFVRTIGLARATMKIGLANRTYNNEMNDLAHDAVSDGINRPNGRPQPNRGADDQNPIAARA